MKHFFTLLLAFLVIGLSSGSSVATTNTEKATTNVSEDYSGDHSLVLVDSEDEPLTSHYELMVGEPHYKLYTSTTESVLYDVHCSLYTPDRIKSLELKEPITYIKNSDYISPAILAYNIHSISLRKNPGDNNLRYNRPREGSHLKSELS